MTHDPNQQNYLRKLSEMTAYAKPGKVVHIDVLHDDGCPFLEGGDCNCNPGIRPSDGREGHEQ